MSQVPSTNNRESWTGSGLDSSTAASVFTNTSIDHRTAIGIGEASDLGLSTFSGRNVDTTSLLLRYTLYGDSNLDGTVDTLDFNQLVTNFGAADATWTRADWDYNSTVDTLDFNELASNFG